MRISDWSSDVCSSDLRRAAVCDRHGDGGLAVRLSVPFDAFPLSRPADHRRDPDGERVAVRRSEEHTSELQSLMRISYAVFCLKKNKVHTDKYNTSQNYCITDKSPRKP